MGDGELLPQLRGAGAGAGAGARIRQGVCAPTPVHEQPEHCQARCMARQKVIQNGIPFQNLINLYLPQCVQSEKN
jgi:hypothetical protein